jgi:ATP diphosphatase
MLSAKPSIEKLSWIMSKLRDPDGGCAWDLKQDFASIAPYTLEEAYEVVNAIEQGDFNELQQELGDLLFHIIFYSQLAQEQQKFDFDGVIQSACEKLIRRHPHVFSDQALSEQGIAKQTSISESELSANWQNEKAKERQLKNNQQDLSILADIPQNLPALSQAAKIQDRCAHVGFDWHHIEDVFAKVVEEVEEVREQLTGNPEALAEELGDLMFAVVNMCRHAKQDPEAILRRANAKFTKRFHGVESQVAASGQAFEAHSLAHLEQYWQQVKATE